MFEPRDRDNGLVQERLPFAPRSIFQPSLTRRNSAFGNIGSQADFDVCKFEICIAREIFGKTHLQIAPQACGDLDSIE